MPALTFRIKLLQPLLAAQTQNGEPNSAISYPFIPGSALRGAVIRRYRRAQPSADLMGATEQHLFFDGAVCYLNAYPAHPRNDRRLLPKPLSWFVLKGDENSPSAPIYDFAVAEFDSDDTFKAPHGEFYHRGDASVQLAAPMAQITVHNASNNRNRKDKATSQVYRYDALAAGGVFAGVICADAAYGALLTDLRALLKAGGLRLGGSLTGGYGAIEIELDEDDAAGWSEYTPDAQDDTRGALVTLTCLSDVIPRDKNGQNAWDWETLAGSKPRARFQKLRLVGGFNRTWGLPLSQAWAIQTGSVFVFDAAQRAQLEALAQTGVGERRAEGFGRVAVNLNIRQMQMQTEMPHRPAERLQGPITLSTTSQAIANTMAERQLRARLERTLVERINALTNNGAEFAHLPSPTQIARAQLAARRAGQARNLAPIADHFRDLSALSRRQWESARLGNQLLLDWIVQQTRAATEFDPAKFSKTVADVEVHAEAWRTEMLARLIEGVLKQALKTAKQKQEGGAV